MGGGKGYDVIMLVPKFQAPAQAEQLTQLITTGKAQAAWVIAVQQASLKPVLELAMQKHAVLVVNGEPKDYGYDAMQPGITFARIDYNSFGGSIGKLTGECIAKNLGGKAKVLFMQNPEGTAGKKAPCIVDGGGNDEVLKAVDDGKLYDSVALNFKADLMQTLIHSLPC